MTRTARAIDRSRGLYERALHSLAGGVGSVARSPFVGYAPHPLYMDYGEGAHLYDVDGNMYVDYLLALGPLILGHRPPAVTRAVIAVLERTGSMLGTNHPIEPEVAEMIIRAVPGADLVRFSSSGTEAVMMALRLARAFTGRRRIVRFEGHYHGWADTIHWSVRPAISAAGLEHAPRPLPAAPGIPDELADSIIVLPWNRPDLLERTMQERHDEIAAVITEPMMANCGCIEPLPGFLKALREITAAYGVLMIFDEVITGFRLCVGGAQEYYGVCADLATFAKALGGGYPISAIAGRRDVMQLVARNDVPYGGTYNTNSMAMAAALATLTELGQPGVFDRLFRLGERLANGLRDAFRGAGVPATVQGLGPVFQIWFTDTPPTTYREAVVLAKPAFYGAFHQAMLRRGVLFHPSQFEHFFLSTAHTEEDIDKTLDAATEAITEVCGSFA